MAEMVNITPELTNCTGDIPESVEVGSELSVTLTASEGHTFEGGKAYFEHQGEYGQPIKIDLTINGNTATGTLQVTKKWPYIKVHGEAVKSQQETVKVTPELTNCTGDIPESVEVGSELSVTLTASEGHTFEGGKAYFEHQGEYGQPIKIDLTINGNTATGTLQVTKKWPYIKVHGDAVPSITPGEKYGSINVYKTTLDELDKFSTKRFFVESYKNAETTEVFNVDLGDFVNKIRRIYTNIPANTTDIIRCGNYNTEISTHVPDVDKITLDFGTAVVPAHNEDNTDYESEIQIFLPFAGFVTLNTDYAGKTIGLQYVINVVTGNGVALLSCNGVIFQVEEIEPSSEIIYLSPSTKVKTIGGDDWNEMLYYGLEPYIYCKWYESASNGRNNDRQTGILGDFRGFNVFDDVTPIHTAEMLTEEQEMIYTALSDGVYIE